MSLMLAITAHAEETIVLAEIQENLECNKMNAANPTFTLVDPVRSIKTKQEEDEHILKEVVLKSTKECTEEALEEIKESARRNFGYVTARLTSSIVEKRRRFQFGREVIDKILEVKVELVTLMGVIEFNGSKLLFRELIFL